MEILLVMLLDILIWADIIVFILSVLHFIPVPWWVVLIIGTLILALFIALSIRAIVKKGQKQNIKNCVARAEKAAKIKIHELENERIKKTAENG